MEKFKWSRFDKGVFLVNVLAIVYDPKTKRILIGRRKKDPYIKGLTWAFPGGRPGYRKDLEDYLKSEVKKKTNLDIKIKELIFARNVPEDRRFLLLYYLVEPKNMGKEKAGEKFTQIKWVRPLEVKKYFTTSIHKEIVKILKELSR
jgi:ADP-ribose pyrophosphatase YjhB (NUDIX family)